VAQRVHFFFCCAASQTKLKMFFFFVVVGRQLQNEVAILSKVPPNSRLLNLKEIIRVPGKHFCIVTELGKLLPCKSFMLHLFLQIPFTFLCFVSFSYFVLVLFVEKHSDRWGLV
jgi:hypothetical protein